MISCSGSEELHLRPLSEIFGFEPTEPKPVIEYPKTDLLEFRIKGSFYPKTESREREKLVYDYAQFCYEKKKEEDKSYQVGVSNFPLEKINVKVILRAKGGKIIHEEFVRAFNAGDLYEIDHYVPYNKEANIVSIKSFIEDEKEGNLLFVEKMYTKKELIKGVDYRYSESGKCHSQAGNRGIR